MNRSLGMIWNDEFGLRRVARKDNSKSNSKTAGGINKSLLTLIRTVFRVAIVMIVLPVQADTTWLGGDGYWDDASKWDAGVPTSDNAAIINSGKVTLNTQDAIADELVVDSELIITGNGQLKVNYLVLSENGSSRVEVMGAKASLEVSTFFYFDRGLLSLHQGGRLISASAAVYNGAGVEITGSGSSWVSSHVISISTNAYITVNNGGSVIADRFNIFGDTADQQAGVLNIGAAEGEEAVAAGRVIGEIVFGENGGKLVLNHSEANYVLASNIFTSDEYTGHGEINLLHGKTQLVGDLSGYAGEMNLKGGTLVIPIE